VKILQVPLNVGEIEPYIPAQLQIGHIAAPHPVLQRPHSHAQMFGDLLTRQQRLDHLERNLLLSLVANLPKRPLMPIGNRTVMISVIVAANTVIASDNLLVSE